MAARFKKSREASLVRADGVVWSRNFLTTPPRPLHLKVASLLLLHVASTPPPAEEASRLRQLAKRSGNQEDLLRNNLLNAESENDSGVRCSRPRQGRERPLFGSIERRCVHLLELRLHN